MFIVPTLQWKRLHPNAKIPVRKHATDAAHDLYLVTDVRLIPGERRAVGLGFACAIPEGYFGRIAPRGSTAHYVAEGVIDAGYRGEWLVQLHNHFDEAVQWAAGDRIAQLLIQAVSQIDFEEVDGLDETPRGDGCLGSTGR